MNDFERCGATPRPRIGFLRNLLAGLALITVGLVLGSVATRPSTAWGEVRTPSPPEHFRSGGQLSLPLLQEISATLRQIDARLARLEASAKQLQTKRPLSSGS